VEIEGELEAEIFEAFFKKALAKLGENLEIDGFRKGKAPENILISSIPEVRILEEMAEMALGEHYPGIIAGEKLDVISRPEIAITKLARNNPLGFKIKTTIMPEIGLGDYKNSAKQIMSEVTDLEKELNVTEEELENTIMDIRKSRAKKNHVADVAQVSDTGEPLVSDTENPKEPELPELNDEFVQAMGPFTTVADFREKLKENLKLEKANLSKEKKRLKIVEKIIEEATIDTPEILIDLELDKILYRMESDITAMGMKFEEYLTHLKKTRDELRKEFRADAEKKAKLGLVLNKISEQEKLVADAEEVEKEVNHILEHYKEADPERARMHAQNILTNEKIFRFLENQ
ncbi:MAG: trigger factor, partial [Candidatus Nomurabacteria bacterium]|nr:trigger factor [Candidatus Nomurabacteria bacterium]